MNITILQQRILFFLLCSTIVPPATQLSAQQITIPSSSINTSLSTTSGITLLHEGVYAVNPALYSLIDSKVVIAQVSPSRFGIKELNLIQATIVVSPMSNLGLAGEVRSAGGSLYSELTASVSSGYSCSSLLSLGVSTHFTRIGFQEFPSQSLITFSAGGLLQLSPIVRTGVSLRNIMGSATSGGEQTVNQQVAFGIGATISPELTLDADAVITLNRSTGLIVATAYKLHPMLSMRLAVASLSRSMDVGLVLNPFESFALLTNIQYHDIFGITYSGGIRYAL
jgi:hypothetical protein